MAKVLSEEDIRLLNSNLYGKIASDDPAMIKEAAEAIDEFTRMRMREDGFKRRILPPIPITAENLDRSVSHSKPYRIEEREPNSPGAITIGFNSQPSTFYIKGDKYEVLFHRQRTAKNVIDVAELATWEMDIRQVITDNNLRDLLAEEDTQFINATNTALVGAGTVLAATGTVQWQTISGGISRESLVEARKIMPSTPNSIEPALMLMNNITVLDIWKFDRLEHGGDVAQEIMLRGWSVTEYMGLQLIITIKKGLVPTNTIFYYCRPDALGKHYVYEPTTMYMRKEGPWVEWYQYQMTGAAFGNIAGLARADFVP